MLELTALHPALLLVGLPLLGALLVALVPAEKFRTPVVWVTLLGLVLGSVILALAGPRTLEFAGSKTFKEVLLVADFLLLGLFVWIAITRKHPLSLLLAFGQIVPLAWLEFFSGAHLSDGPLFVVDGLALTMVLIASLVGALIVVFAIPYMREHESHLHLAKSRQPQFFGFLLLFLGAMNGLLLANNLLVLYFFWEVTTLCCVLLIGHDKTPEAIANSTRALWMNLLGGVAFVAALVYLGVQGLPVSLTALIEDPSVHSAALIPAALLAVAGFTKAAQMPFQGWLLGAMVAPTPVSALLHSSTMVKAGVYLVLRMTPVLGASAFVADAVAIAGAFTFVVTAMIAVSERNAKKVLAYSTISNLGLIIACAGLNTAMAYSAAVMLIIFHAVSKALLFMGVGTVEQAIKSRMIEDMEGLISKLPVVTAAMVIGILSMLLPPFGVLVAKWAALEASANLPLVMVMFVLGSAFTVAFWTKWVGRLLERTPGSAYESDGTLPALLRGPIVVLAVAAIGLSLLVSVIIQSGVAPAVSQMYLEAGYTGSVAGIESAVGWFPVLGITIFLFLAVLVPVWLTRGATEDETSVYACGENLVEEGRLEFRSDSDKPTEILVRGYYFDKFFGEQKHLPWATAVGAVLLLVVLGAALPL